MRIKDLPLSQRPDERALEMGVGALTDTELLAVVIRTGSKGKSSLELAGEVLSIDRGKRGLLNFASCSYADFIRLKGLGCVKALKLSCICELSRRISQARLDRKTELRDASSVAEFYMESVRHLDAEVIYMMFTDVRGRFIKSELISRGSVDRCFAGVRDIIKTAPMSAASGMILVHNHPSGTCEPSGADIEFARTLKDAGSIMGIDLKDSIIIGDGDYLSMSERGLL